MPRPKKKPAAAACVVAVSATVPPDQSVPKPSKVKVVKPFLRGTAAAKAYYSDIAELSGGGVSAGQVHTVLDGLRKVCVRDLKANSIFKLHGIANYVLKRIKVSGVQEVSGNGWKFTVHPSPPEGRRRVYCNTLKEVEKEVVHRRGSEG